MPVEKMSAQEWLASRIDDGEWLAGQIEAGLKIDSQTAEVDWVEFDLYESGLYGGYPKALREYYARAPKSDTWVWFINLPKATETALWEKLKRKLVD